MSVKILLIAMLMLVSTLSYVHTQEQPAVTIQITPFENIILAVADVQPAAAEKSAELEDSLKTINQVLWDDLSFSGFFTLAGKSFYPPQAIVNPEQDIQYTSWEAIPFKVSFLTVGTLDISGGVLRADLKVYDMKQRKRILDQSFSGPRDQIRTIAHRWADVIVFNLTAGASEGIASTKIAYSSRRGNAKEIYTVDYDGYNAHPFTHNGSNNLFPNWAPDNSKLAFVSFRTGRPEINIYSYIDGSRLSFPMFNSLASTPSISPDGTHIAFDLRTTRPAGDTDIFISKLDGSDRRNITNNPALDTSPVWSPSGKQIAFSSSREGRGGQIFICDVDGSNVRRIVKEGGDAASPAWSPDGRWLAFQWKPHLSTNYDLFMADVAGGSIRQLTSGAGSNESPSWAPDGRHLAFQSNRNGGTHVYIMLLGDSNPRKITAQGSNTSPAWSGYFRRTTGN
ncbi:MAG: PD40 domain-containing protein [Acidobacteria bacterium]|nr:PD40 domain-containing protein [Acidobacteriota bacterium]